MNATNGNMIMAIDCIKGGASVKNAMTTANRIAQKCGWTTKAVSVMSPDQVSWPADFATDWYSQFEKAGEIALGKFLKRNRSHPSLQSKILFQPYHSRKASIQALIKELQSTQASAVTVFTHIDQKSKSALPAGFVSSLISQAGVPVIAINAKAPPLRSLKTILFATDFSDVDESAFDTAIQVAKSADAELFISHILPNLANETMAAYAGICGGWNSFQGYLDVLYEEKEILAKRWIEKARSKGVEAGYELLWNSRTIPGGILRAVKKHSADVIIMTEKTGPWEAILLGSVTRKVLEKSLHPVMVIPAKSKRSRTGSAK